MGLCVVSKAFDIFLVHLIPCLPIELLILDNCNFMPWCYIAVQVLPRVLGVHQLFPGCLLPATIITPRFAAL